MAELIVSVRFPVSEVTKLASAFLLFDPDQGLFAGLGLGDDKD